MKIVHMKFLVLLLVSGKNDRSSNLRRDELSLADHTTGFYDLFPTFLSYKQCPTFSHNDDTFVSPFKF